MDGGGDRRRITRLLFPLLPFHYALSRPAEHRLPFPVLLPHAVPQSLSGRGIKRHHSRIRLPADHDDQSTTFENWRTANAEERGRHGPLRRRIPLPDQLAGLEIEANQFALGAEGVTTVSRQQRRAARPIVVA